MDIYARAEQIRAGIVDPGFLAELDQDVMAFREHCERIGKTVAQASEAVFRAAVGDPYSDRWIHAEAIAAWALLEPVTIE